jgi:hypothetical protein
LIPQWGVGVAAPAIVTTLVTMTMFRVRERRHAQPTA